VKHRSGSKIDVFSGWVKPGLVKHGAVGAMAAQVTQAGASFTLQVIAIIALGLAGFGKFAILYGVIVLLTGLTSGFVGDSLTVLNRRSEATRSALQGWALALIGTAAAFGGVAVATIGFVSYAEAVFFGLAIFAFLLEDLLRRLLMAELLFWRIAIVDTTGLIVALAVLAGTASVGAQSLATLFGALAIGQLAALVTACLLLPREERYLVRFVRGAYGTVARYGSWRSAQQAVRPGLLTAVRTAVILAAGLTMMGELEAARLFVAPAMLLVSGYSTFLFASFAAKTRSTLGALLVKADRAVFQLLVATVVIGGSALLALPEIGQLVIGHRLNVLMVVGWIAYAASVATVTPYGALAAVRGKQAAVFGVRMADSGFSLATAVLLLGLGGPVEVVPFALTLGSVLGGLAIRSFLLRPHLTQEQVTPDMTPVPEKKAATHV
jgi:O-antigen/teichoic acid export membrane protein